MVVVYSDVSSGCVQEMRKTHGKKKKKVLRQASITVSNCLVDIRGVPERTRLV